MPNDFAPPITSVGAGEQVSSAFEQANSWGAAAFETALQSIGELGELNFEPVIIGGPSFSIPGNLFNAFQEPSEPARPDLSNNLEIDVPTAPVFSPISVPGFGSPPSFSGSPPQLNFGSRPSPLGAEVPTDVPELLPVTLPEDPELPFPELPSMEELNLPAPPDIIEHEFLGERPEFTGEVPDVGVAFTYEFTEYSSELLDEVQTEVSRMLKGGTGLPPAIEQMIFDRSRAREDSAADRAVMEALDEWASRGFSLPSGIVDKRIRQVRQENQSQRATLNRELTVYVHEKEIENLRFAVTQGVALENISTQLFIQSEQVKLQAAQIAADFVFNAFRLKVEIFNTEVRAFAVDAEVYATLIRAEMAKVERFRAQLEAERVKGEINQQRIDIYRARLDALNTMVAIYSSRVEAARTVAQTNESKVRTFVARVEAFRTQVQAKESEFNAWAAGVQGELGKMQGFEAETRAFSARTAAFEAGVRASAVQVQSGTETERLKFDSYRAEIEGVRAEIQAEAARVQGLASIYGSDASIYAAGGQIAANKTDASTRQFQAALEAQRSQVEFSLNATGLQVQQAIGMSQIGTSIATGRAQAASQLAAASMSSVGASASISEQGSASNTWQHSSSFTQSESQSYIEQRSGELP